MQQFREILLGIAMLAVASCQSSQQIEDRLVAAFGETMFDTGPAVHGKGGIFSADGTLAKWESPVYVAVVEGATPENIALATEKLSGMAKLSGLAFEWVEAADPRRELEIHFSKERNFVINGNEQAACYAGTAAPRNGLLAQASIHIGRVKDGEWRTDCLNHELLHALGWRGHTHRVRSVISYAHGETELTKWDRIIMRTLYDPRLLPGISKEDALPVARVILREMIQN